MCKAKTQKRRSAVSVFLTIALQVTGCIPLMAQSGGSFQITNSAIAGGGGESRDLTNNRFGHECTVGEHAAGTLLRNPPYSQTAGLWASDASFTPTASSALISGRIVTSDGAPLAGVTISLEGSRSRRVITDAHGNYSFTDLEAGGFYIVTPSSENYVFSPRELSFSLLADKTDAAFTATQNPASVNPLSVLEIFARYQHPYFLIRVSHRLTDSSL